MTGFSNIGQATGFAGVDLDGNPSGDLTGSFPNPLVVGIWDNPVDPRVPNNGDTLVYNGGEWIPTPSPSNTAALFKGVWDANANNPDIANFPGLSDGFTWLVQVAGNTSVGGITGWLVGDYAIYSGGNWYKLSNSSFGWGLTGNAGTIPTVNYVGTSDTHDLSLRANAIEGLRIYYTTGDVNAAQNLTVAKSITATQNITGSNIKSTADLAVDGGNVTSTAATFNLLAEPTTVNIAAGATTGINAGNAAGINTISGTSKFPQGLSGSLTKLSTGESAFVADTGVLITSASNGSVTFKIDDSKFASLTGSNFSGAVVFNAGLSGSLTRLQDGTSYILGATNTLVTTGSNGSITISTPAAGLNAQVQFNDGGTLLGANSGFTYNKSTNDVTISGDAAVNGGDITTTSTTGNLFNTTATTVNLGSGATTGIFIGNAAGTNVVSGTTKFPQGLSGSITTLADGTSYIKGATNTSVTTGSNGSITVSTPAAGLDTQVQFNDGGTLFGANSGLTYNKTTNSLTVSGNEAVNGGNLTTTSTTFNLLNSTSTTINFGGGATLGVNIGNSSGTNVVSGTTKFPQGLSGSLTKLADGTSYLIAGGNIAVTSASNGPVTVAFNTPTAPSLDDLLIYNGTSWTPSSIINTLQTSYQTVRAQGNILAGDVCYIVNAGGSNPFPTVAKAQANSISTCKGVIGFATTNIAANTTGTVQTYGQLPGPVTTNTFSQGAPLYVSTTVAGGVTDVKPSGPNIAFQVGFVTRQGQPNNVNTGIVFVSPMQETNTQNINDFVLTTPAEHEVLTYEASTTQWKNKQTLWVPNTQTAFTVAAAPSPNNIITVAAITNVVYLPINTQGGANVTLNATTPIASLTKTAVDYGRELWLHNLDNNRNVSIPSGGNVKLETAALVGGNLVLAPNAFVKFVWTGIGGNGSWVQTSKVLIVA